MTSTSPGLITNKGQLRNQCPQFALSQYMTCIFYNIFPGFSLCSTWVLGPFTKRHFPRIAWWDPTNMLWYFRDLASDQTFLSTRLGNGPTWPSLRVSSIPLSWISTNVSSCVSTNVRNGDCKSPWVWYYRKPGTVKVTWSARSFIILCSLVIFFQSHFSCHWTDCLVL